MPEHLIVEKSQYFKAAYRGDWKEAQTRTVKLQDVDVEAFDSYMFWIHRGELAINTDFDLLEGGKIQHAAAYAHINKLVRLWLLGDRLSDSKFRNTVMDAILGVFSGLISDSGTGSRLLPPHLTVLIWSNTTEGRALRRLVIDYYLYAVTPEEMDSQWDKFHPDFVKELAVGALKRPSEARSDPREVEVWTRRICDFHEHGLNEDSVITLVGSQSVLHCVFSEPGEL